MISISGLFLKPKLLIETNCSFTIDFTLPFSGISFGRMQREMELKEIEALELIVQDVSYLFVQVKLYV